MRVSKYLKYVCGVTILSLTYIHMQMQIITLAYHGKEKEKQIRNITEENGHITYSILILTSAKNLGGKLLDEKSDMQFVDKSNIVHVASSNKYAKDQGKKIANKRNAKDTNPLLSLLSFNDSNSLRIKK